MNLETILISSVYFLAIINPVSKISILSVFSSEKKDLRGISVKATLISALILLTVMFFGDFLMRKIFQINLHSLQISGGIVLAWVGFNALRKGVFFEVDTHNKFSDIAIVPLACPMIAGPATIAATLTFAAQNDKNLLVIALGIALVTNLLLMLSASTIGNMLKRFNILGALIRITGLFVMTIGVQMILNGSADWHKSAIKKSDTLQTGVLLVTENKL